MEYLKNSLDMLVFLAIPQVFLYSWFILLFWGIQTARFFERLLWFSVIHAICVDITVLAVPTYIHLINSLISFFVIFHLFFRELPVRTKLLVQISYFILVILSDTLSIITTSQFIDNIELLRTGPTFYKIIFVWPYLAIIAFLCLIFQRRRYYPAVKVRNFLTEAKDASLIYFILLIFIQVLILSLFVITRYFSDKENVTMILFYIGLASVVVVSFTALRLMVKTRQQAIQMTQNVYVGDLMQMLTSIRGQRHDFLNHIQVMSSMITMKRYEQLKQYIGEVAADIQTLDDSKIRQPYSALAALIQAKATIAADKNIQFSYFLPDSLDFLQSVKIIDLVRMIGNLIDNAFDEAVKLPDRDRIVRFSIEVEQYAISIVVSNRGNGLSEEEKRMMFTPGYTTKEHSHSGLGLPIVLDLVKRYKGSISVDSDEEFDVVFQLTLPLTDIITAETAAYKA